MKTLLVQSNQDGFIVSIQRHIEKALTDLEIEWRHCWLADVTEVAKEFGPTMTIFFHPNKDIYKYREEIKDLPGHKLMWSMEDPYECDITFDLAEEIYYIFTTDLNVYEQLVKERGDKNKVVYVPHACDPDIHKPMEVPYMYKSDILFIGNAYESRIKYFQDHAREFKDKMVTIIGVGYRGMDGYQNQRVIHGHTSEPDLVKYYNGAKVILNLHRQNSDLDMANSRKIEPRNLNNRFYEISAVGRPQIIEGRDNMQEEVEEVGHQLPEDYSYKARLVKYYMPLLKI